jgi:hypothetical protein
VYPITLKEDLMMENFFRECARLCAMIGDEESAEQYMFLADYYSGAEIL